METRAHLVEIPYQHSNAIPSALEQYPTTSDPTHRYLQPRYNSSSPALHPTASKRTTLSIKSNDDTPPQLLPEILCEIGKLTDPKTIRNLRNTNKLNRSFVTERDLVWAEAGWRYFNKGLKNCCYWAVRAGHAWILELYATDIGNLDQITLDILLIASLKAGRDAVTDVIVEAGGNRWANHGRILELAARSGYMRLVQNALMSGIRRRGRSTILFFAAAHGHGAMVKLLLGTRLKGDDLAAALSRAASGNHVAIMTLLLNTRAYTAEQYDDALQNAISNGATDAVRLLLASGAKIDASPDWLLEDAISRGHLETLKELLEAGADI
ncbi:hypothetical protein HDV00_003073 [Rhizophlyctis rosea]|nr:hypothetical protein HDV00_003073 [Rhizophlyctis rosea]